MRGSPPRTRRVESGGIAIGGEAPPLIIAGPDTLESRELVTAVARELQRLSQALSLTIVFKGSYDKANRSSHLSYRGPGLERGLEHLRWVKDTVGLPVTSDVHTPQEVKRAAEVLDIIQIPAFLCRQNDLLQAAAATGKIVNIKKGQFLAPANVAARVRAAAGPDTPGVIVTERGTTCGRDLINDFRSLPAIRSQGTPVVFDATHSAQSPGALGDRSGGDRELVPVLARAAAGAGCDGFFFEVHPDPEKALCDGPSSLYLEDLEPLLSQLAAIDRMVRGGAPE